MGKVEEARQLLKEIGMPDKQQADLCCYVLLAMANIKETDTWRFVAKEWIRIHDIIQNFAVFKKFSDSLAWETEVWISEMPDHMIHLNGDRFVGPRNYDNLHPEQ